MENIKKYGVYQEINCGDSFNLFNSDDLEAAKKEAREHASINKRDRNKGTIILVSNADYEAGNYNLINYND